MADWKRGIRRVLYPAYEARMVKALPDDQIPKHVGVMLDGNRRWAKAVGADTAHGYRAGAANIEPLLDWCEEVGVEVVTLWLLSTDNLNRPPDQLGRAAQDHRGRGRDAREGAAAGGCTRWARSTCCRPRRPRRLKDAEEATRDVDGPAGQHRRRVRRPARDRGRRALAAPGAGGKGMTLEELAEVIDVEHIAEHLYTKGQPDPDLVIRTSGEQRLGGFLLWQSAHSEFYFCEAFWPDFRRVDFLRAIRAYAQRERRFGS